MEKWVIDRRLQVMEAEGVVFKTNADVGKNIPASELMDDYDAVILCGGATVPRDLPIPGRELKGVHYAMDFLTQQNKRVAGDQLDNQKDIWATDKHVIVIGGGDTGSDCVGTSNRHGAKSVTQIELLAKPPTSRSQDNPWPEWPMVLRTSSSHEEGAERHWALLTKEFVGDGNGNVKGLKLTQIEWEKPEPGKRPGFKEIEGSEKTIDCDLALLAIGFVHPQHEGMLQQMGLELDDRGNLKATDYQTNVDKVFTAGDMRRGQSLVVWAIAEGREAAKACDTYLMGFSELESRDDSFLNVSQMPG